MTDDAPPRMMPTLDAHNRSFWTGGADGALLISRCPRCALWVSPPAAECPQCEGALEPQRVSGRGRVFTYTVNHQPFNPAVPVPYVIAIVELEEQSGLRLATNIVGCEPESVYVGMPVEVRFERQDTGDDTVYAPVFTPRGE